MGDQNGRDHLINKNESKQNEKESMLTNNWLFRKVRTKVSKRKKRFQEDGFDLDMSYISNQVIVMGFPSENTEAMYRNPMNEVQRFLNTVHGKQYKVYNLCSEKDYDHTKFQKRVARYKIESHSPCCFNMIFRFCKD